MSMQYTTSKDGTRIAYDKVGQGPPLIYVMGATGTRKISFMTAIRDELAKSFTLYYYDRRGRGETGDNSPTKYEPEREIEDLRAMVDVAGGEPFVVASSSGAALALLAAASGVPMKKLVAHEPPYAVGPHGEKFDRNYQRNVTQIVAEGRSEDAMKYFMKIVGVPSVMVWVMRFMPFWKDAVAAAPSLPYDAAVMGNFDLPEKRLREIRTPTLVIYGGSTPPMLQDAAKAAAAVIPNATLRMVPKQNHGIKPAALREVLIQECR